MLRAITVALALVPLAGCSKLLGFEEPVRATDGGGGADSAVDGPVADFTVQLAHAGARVPAGSFDFIEVTVARGAGAPGRITVDVPQPPAGVTTMAATIEAGAQTGQVKVIGDASLTIGSTLMLDVVATGGGFTHDAQATAVVTGIPGTLDVGFGSNHTGVVDLALGSLAGSYTGIAVDGANQVYASGTVQNSIANAAGIGVLTADGVLVKQSTSVPCSCSAGGFFTTVAVASTGRVFAVGQAEDKSPGPGNEEPLVVAFTATGDADTDFNSTGVVFVPLGADLFMKSVALDATNVLLLTNNGLLARLIVATGAKDFGWNFGEALPVGIAAPGPQGVAADVAQHVYVAGQGSGGTAVVERITEQGAIDTAFGSNGIVDSGVAGAGRALLVEADHGVIVAGTAGGNFLLFRVLPSGVLDPAFGTAGVAQPAVPYADLALTGMAVQADGKIVLAGNGGGSAVLVRYTPNGALDPTFGTNGAASIPAGVMPVMGGVAIQSTGKIVIDGGNADQTHSNGVNGNGFVARVWF